MVYKLPKMLPEQLIVAGKTYARVGGAMAVSRGVCKGNDGAWHYYFNKAVVDSTVGAIGDRRHFSVCSAAGRRSVHVSMKPQSATDTALAKPDEILIWYRYDSQWTGRQTEAEGWGRTAFAGKDAVRVAKAVGLLTQFLEAMTATADSGKKPAVKKVLTPPLSSIKVVSDEEAEAAFEASQKKPVVVATSSNAPEFDNWEDDPTL